MIMHIMIFLLMNLIVIGSSFLITYKLFKFSNLVDSIISCFVFYFSQIIVSELILGVLGILSLKNIIILNLLILAGFWIITRDKEFGFSSGSIGHSIAELTKNKVALLGITLIVSFSLVKIFINLVNPPFGWDSINYHFTFAVEWLKQASLATPIVVFDDPSPTYYPINGNLFYLWLIFPFKSVFLADLGQVPFFALAFMAVYNISRRLNLDKQVSFYAASLFLLIPNFFKQLQIAYVDVMVAGLFLVSLNYLFAISESFSRQNVLLYSLSIGLLLGTKTVALPYSALLLLPFAYCWFKNTKKYYLLFLILAILILGGFSYLRNFLETGNPLYPLNFKLFDQTILKGVMDTSTYSARFNLQDYRLSKLLFHEGLGAQTLIFVLPAVFLALPLTLIRNKKNINFNLVYFLILPILIYLVYRFIIPLANTRYIYPLLGVGMIMGFYTYNLLKIPRIMINTLAAISILASVPELAKRQELVFSILLTLISFFLLVPLIKYSKKHILARKKIFIGLSVLAALFILGLSERYYLKNEYPRYLKMVKYSGFWPDAAQAWEWLNKNTSGNNIAYAGRPVTFPLYGSGLKNSVYYVSVNGTEPAKLHYFPNSRYQWGADGLSMHRDFEAAGNYRSNADYAVWLLNLKKRGSDYLFAYSLHHTKEIEFPAEDAWAKFHPEIFNPVFTNQTIHIYKVAK